MWTKQSDITSVVDERGGDLREYLDRLTNKASIIKWALVASSEKDHGWAGDWVVNDVPCFLVLLCRESEMVDENKGRGRKKRKALVWLDTHYIWCCGNDDLFMNRRNIPAEEAIALFDLITTDGVSRKELEAFGLGYW